MNKSPHESFQQALDELRRTQKQLGTIRSELQEKATKVTSKDGMITVTLDGRSELAGIAFNTAKFLRMAPAELGRALLETTNQARALDRSRVTYSYSCLMPEGTAKTA